MLVGTASVDVAAATPFRAVGWYSTNWAGYVSDAGTCTSISGQWTVPSVTPGKTGFSATWIGIGGVSEHELIQVGTFQNAVGGRATYFAWWEILPAAATEIHSFSVHPGDHINASIKRIAGSRWQIAISNSGHGSFTATRTFSGDGSSAEWIVEAPVVGRRVAPLAQFSLVTFDHLTANGKNPRLTASEGGALFQGGVRVATPSVPDAERDGFAVRRSSSAPSPPGP